MQEPKFVDITQRSSELLTTVNLFLSFVILCPFVLLSDTHSFPGWLFVYFCFGYLFLFVLFGVFYVLLFVCFFQLLSFTFLVSVFPSLESSSFTHFYFPNVTITLQIEDFSSSVSCKTVEGRLSPSHQPIYFIP